MEMCIARGDNQPNQFYHRYIRLGPGAPNLETRSLLVASVIIRRAPDNRYPAHWRSMDVHVRRLSTSCGTTQL